MEIHLGCWVSLLPPKQERPADKNGAGRLQDPAKPPEEGNMGRGGSGRRERTSAGRAWGAPTPPTCPSSWVLPKVFGHLRAALKILPGSLHSVGLGCVELSSLPLATNLRWDADEDTADGLLLQQQVKANLEMPAGAGVKCPTTPGISPPTNTSKHLTPARCQHSTETSPTPLSSTKRPVPDQPSGFWGMQHA